MRLSCLKTFLLGVSLAAIFAVGCSGNNGGPSSTDLGIDQATTDQQELDAYGEEVNVSNDVMEAGSEDVGTQEVAADSFEEVQPECQTDQDCQSKEHSVCETVYCDAGTCKVKELADYTACDDKNVCTIGDYCQAGKCVSGRKTDCDDGNPCTTDTCDPAQGCRHQTVDDGSACDDGSALTSNDVCKNGECAGVSDIACQTDQDCPLADPDDKCKGHLVCDTSTGKCVLNPKSVIHCIKPADPCLTSECEPETGRCRLVNAKDGTACDDGLLCTVGDQCKDGKCESGENKCGACGTDDDCKVFYGGNACYGAPKCVDGACKAGDAVKCEQSGDGTCGVSECNPVTGKCEDVLVEDGRACVTSLCKDGQVCNQGLCVGGTDTDCDDSDPCTKDSCDADKGCVHTPIEGCVNCKQDTDCDDQNQCTEDKCVDGACVWDPLDKQPCDDGNPCTLNDTCNKDKCEGGKEKDCADDKPCTADSCDPASGECKHTPIEGCENCFNGVDDNDNGWTDCDDTYCADDPKCKDIHTGDTCANPFLINDGNAITFDGLGDNKVITISGNLDNNFTDNYRGTCMTKGPGDAADAVYRLVLGEGMKVKVSMDFAGDAQTSSWAVTYIYKGVCGDANRFGCAAGKNLAATIDEALPAGTYYIVVDGEYARADVGPYTLTLSFEQPPATETDCNNHQDDDLDGKMDCLDEDCANDPSCAPCETTGDLTCGGSITEPATRDEAAKAMYKFTTAYPTKVTLDLAPTNQGALYAINVYEDTAQGCDDKKEVIKGAVGEGVSFESEADKTYYFEVISAGASSLAYTITADCHNDKEISCNNGMDEDNNGLTDCQDPACFQDDACTGGHTGEDCADPYLIKDGEGIDITDMGKTYTYYNTTDGANGDLQADCATDSDKAPDKVYKLVVEQPSDVRFILTPEDGFQASMYYFKDDCTTNGAVACAGESEGKLDLEANLDPGTYFVVIDGSADGGAGSYQLDVTINSVTAKEICDNGKDDDLNKATDCQDPACFDDPACTGGHTGEDCSDPFVVKDTALGAGDSFDFWNNTMDKKDDLSGSCGGKDAGDLVYTFTLDTSLEVSASLEFMGFVKPAMYLFKDSCGATEAEVDCQAATAQKAEMDKVLDAGTYYLVVDGVDADNAAPYSLHIEAKEPPQPEASCWNSADDDNNGATDCDDDTCKDQPVCTAQACQAAKELHCGDTITITNFDKDWTNVVDQFTCGGKDYKGYANYPEYTAALTVPCNTNVHVTLTEPTPDKASYDLYVLDGSDACDPAACKESAFAMSDTVTTDFEAQAGQKFYIVAAMMGLYSDPTKATQDTLTLKVECECAAQPKVGDVVVTEMMVNPASVDTDKQYVELYNTTDKPLSLAGCYLTTSGGTLMFTDQELSKGSYMVVGSDQHVGDALPEGTLFLQGNSASFGLNTTADTVALKCAADSDETVIDSVAYDTANGWTINEGKALNLDPDKYDATANDDPANWCDSTTEIGNGYSNDDDGNGGVLPNYGTPGAANTSCSTSGEAKAPNAGEVVITELMPNPDSDDTGREYFEVYNTTDHAISLDGCVITSKGGSNGESFTVSPADDGMHDTQIQAKGYFVFGLSQTVKAVLPQGTPFYQYTGLTLANHSDWVQIDCNNTTIDRVEYSTVYKGHALNLDPAKYDATANDDPANWCKASTALDAAYNTDGKDNFGTPGAQNDACQ